MIEQKMFVIRIFDRPLSKYKDTRFLMCPTCKCNNGITVKVASNTELLNFPMYCRRCKGHFQTMFKDGIQLSLTEEKE